MFDLVPDMAFKRAELTPDKTAFVEDKSARKWSFSDVNAAANAVARGLTEQGLGEGDRLAILCHNCAEFFVVMFACQKTGIILCPLNWRQPVAELKISTSIVDPTALIFGAGFEVAANGLSTDEIACLSIEEDVRQWINAGGPEITASIPATRPWYVLFTSGTTGLPKAVIQTARMCWANATNIGQAVEMTGNDKAACFLPLFHTAGINLYTLPIFLHGGCSTVLPKFDEKRVMDMLLAGEITQFFAVPAVYQALAGTLNVKDVNWSQIRAGCGGAPLPEPLIRLFAQMGAYVLNGMGMTETGPTAFLMDPEHAETKIGSVGKVQALTEVRLDGVKDGCVGEGEIQFRGPAITPGYFKNEAATKATFTEAGWLATGDIGRRDADGYYYIVDRIKDMFISGGENVYPAEVERVLHEHPAILEAAVIGVKDERWGEVGAAYVMLRADLDMDVAKLRDWCAARLATYKVPAIIEVVDEFPRTAAGKIKKAELKR